MTGTARLFHRSDFYLKSYRIRSLIFFLKVIWRKVAKKDREKHTTRLSKTPCAFTRRLLRTYFLYDPAMEGTSGGLWVTSQKRWGQIRTQFAKKKKKAGRREFFRGYT